MSSAVSGRSAADVPAVVTGAAGAATTGLSSGESGCCAAATPTCNAARAASQPFRQPIMAFAIVSRLGGAIGLLPLITKTRFAMHQAPVGANRYKSAWAMSTNIAPLALVTVGSDR